MLPPPDVHPKTLDSHGILLAWPRFWVLDFGYTNPLCLQWWAEDPDSRLYCYGELYEKRYMVAHVDIADRVEMIRNLLEL
jgi:phage terminase large subunit